MFALRHLLAQRRLATLLCAATLVLKLLVPAGYMIGSMNGHLALEVCSGFAPASMMAQAMHGDMPDHAGPEHDPANHGGSKHGGGAEMPCAFSALSAASLGAVDPVQLAALIAFIVAVGLYLAVSPAPTSRAHLRPPLRGPPVTL